MSFVVPHGEMWTLANIPLDNKYENVFRFPKNYTRATIQDWFINRIYSANITGHYDDLSYQRIDNQTFKVNAPAWEHYTDNYIIFRNHGIGSDGQYYGTNDYYFGFITDVLYINDNCTQFTYEIDWMTTWFNNCTFEDCFIDRCTPDSDIVGDNIVPENFGALGDYLHGNQLLITPDNNQVNVKAGWNPRSSGGMNWEYQTIDLPSDSDTLFTLSALETAILVCEVNDDGTELEKVNGTYIENNYSGATLYLTHNAQADDLDEFLEQYIQKPESIVAMYRIPRLAEYAITRSASTDANLVVSGVYEVKSRVNNGTETPIGGSFFTFTSGDTTVSNGTANFGYYYPINKKLYTYPYNYLSVNNGCGDHMDLRYEYFSHYSGDAANPPTFIVEMSIVPPVQVRILPLHYGYNMSHTDENDHMFQYQLTLAEYPECSWNTDYYAAWLAQNSVPIAISSAAGFISSLCTVLAGAAIGGAIGGPAGAVAGAGILSSSGALAGAFNAVGSSATQVSGMLNEQYAARIHADNYYGNLNSGNLSNAQYESQFYLERVNVNEETAKMIDDYFSLYGYAQKKVMNIKDIVYSNGNTYCYIKATGVQCNGDPDSSSTTEGLPTKAREAIETILERGTRFWNSSTPSRIGDILNNRSGNNAPCGLGS